MIIGSAARSYSCDMLLERLIGCLLLVASAGSKSASAAALEGPPTSAELTSNFTRAHRSVIAARDRTYAAYRVYYGQHVHELARSCDAVLASERQWALNWSNMVSQLKAESE